MSHPDLYRSGNTKSPRFENVRNDDIPDFNGMVKPGTGGISTFAAIPPGWKPNTTWVLKRSVSLGSLLRAVNDRGSHWMIEPSKEMTRAAYITELNLLNSKAVLVPSTPQDVPAELQLDLPSESSHDDRATRFVFNALATVVRERVVIGGWDSNDYTYIAVLASELERSALSLSSLVCDSNVAGEWTKEMAFVAQAVSAYMGHSSARAAGNEDEEADANNDNAYLQIVLKLDVPENPLSALL